MLNEQVDEAEPRSLLEDFKEACSNRTASENLPSYCQDIQMQEKATDELDDSITLSLQTAEPAMPYSHEPHSVKPMPRGTDQALHKPDSVLEKGIPFPPRPSSRLPPDTAAETSHFARRNQQSSSQTQKFGKTPAPKMVSSSPMQPSSRWVLPNLF